ncbi:hypothetical protein AKJ16_DCAP12340 [Drosera capensis]
MGKAHHAVEVAKTVIEVAEVAFSAVEKIHHLHDPNHDHGSESGSGKCCVSEEELEEIRAENRRLRDLLEENLRVLERISASGGVEGECPSDLHKQLVSTVESDRFLKQLQSLRGASLDRSPNEFPFRKPTATDLDAVEVLVNVDQEEPSWWVWVTKEMVPGTVEEQSGIDDESYVIVCEEHVVDGVSNFIARCILSNPKALKLTPEQLQKRKKERNKERKKSAERLAVESCYRNAFVFYWHLKYKYTGYFTVLMASLQRYQVMQTETIAVVVAGRSCLPDISWDGEVLTWCAASIVAKSVSGINKFEKMLNVWEAGKLFYALSTWGLALAGLYRSRRVIKFAAKGIHTTGKLVLKAL